MSWEQDLAGYLDDLEGQAEAVLRSERDEEIVEQARAEYATIAFVTRLMASVGREVELQVSGLGRVQGRLDRCTESWCVIEGSHRTWVVQHHALMWVVGASERSLPREAWPLTAAVGIGSAMRRVAESGESVVLVLADGNRLEGAWARIGKDFSELVAHGTGVAQLVPHRAISAFSPLPRTALQS